MRTVEERLECLKETVLNQKIKINDLDKKIDELESALRKEQAIKNPTKEAKKYLLKQTFLH